MPTVSNLSFTHTDMSKVDEVRAQIPVTSQRKLPFVPVTGEF